MADVVNLENATDFCNGNEFIGWHWNTRSMFFRRDVGRLRNSSLHVSGVATSTVVLRWFCDSPRTECAWRTTPYIYVARTSNNRVIVSCELYCCLLPQCEALRTCRSGFPIASLSCSENVLTSNHANGLCFFLLRAYQHKCITFKCNRNGLLCYVVYS